MKDPLFFNKMAAALLTAALLFFGLPQLAIALKGGHHGGHGDELHLAYAPVDLSTLGASAGAAPKGPTDLGSLIAAVDPAAAKRRAATCGSCHTFEQGGANGTGPNLWNVVNRAVGGHPGFSYTGALKAAGGVWTYDRLDKFLENSQSYVPGTAMVQRYPKAEQRAEILVYLASLSDAPVPFPAPVAVEAAAEPAPADGAAVAEAAPAEEPAAH